MRLAESQAHQPFPGFFEPGFFYLYHRCKGPFQAVLQDSNLLSSCIGPEFHPFQQRKLLMKQKFRLFCKNKYHKFSSAVLLVLPDLRNSAFSYTESMTSGNAETAPPLFCVLGGMRKCSIIKSISVRTPRRRTMRHSAAPSRRKMSAVQSSLNAGTARIHGMALSAGKAKITACGHEWTRSMTRRREKLYEPSTTGRSSNLYQW